jgi:amphiphysin
MPRLLCRISQYINKRWRNSGVCPFFLAPATYSAALKFVDTLAPELELIESRIVNPCKDLQEICKKIRKTCVKRDHKLIDFDRHNNALNKLREKKEKSLSDEKNLFKVEQDFELSSGEYEHYNNLLKTELPQFIQMATRFIDPLFHSFYYMQYVLPSPYSAHAHH